MTASTELTVAEQPQQVALTALDRAVIALGGTEREDALKALAKKYADITEVKNKAGRQQVHAAAMELANERIATKKTGETAREDANALQKAVIERQKVLIGIVEPEEKRLLALRDKFDEAEEAEKEAKAAAEKARVDFIRKRIGEIQAIPAESVGRSAADLAATIELTEGLVITIEEFGEFSGECEMAKIAATAKLGEMLSAQVATEQAAAEAARQAEADRIERERVAEANRVEAKRLADLAAELERQAQEARDKQAEADRIAREQREAAEAEQRAANERAAAAMRQQQAEHEARMRAQQEEIDRQQAAIDTERQRQADEAVRVEREKQAAIEAEAARVAAVERQRREAEEAAARAEAARKVAEERAKEAERLRRLRVEFEENGPGDLAIVEAIANRFEVSEEVAARWLTKFNAAPFLTPYAEKAA